MCPSRPRLAIPADAPGFAAGKPEEKAGPPRLAHGPLFFTDCRIPAGNLVAEEGQGLKLAFATLDHFRLGIAA